MKKLVILALMAAILTMILPTPAVVDSYVGSMYVCTENGRNLNVRSSPAMGNNIVGSMEYGAEVIVVETRTDGWAQILWEEDMNGEFGTAYVQSRFLQNDKPDSHSGQAAGTPASDAADYAALYPESRVFDSDWASGTAASDPERTEAHEPITRDLILLLEHDPELKTLLEQSIAQAALLNPDLQTNPVNSLESYYEFIDWSIRAMPWAINPTEEYIRLYDRIDQSIGCFYFICDQPLADKGYYHNSIMYHEPFRSWLVKFTSEYGAYLNTEESWCDEYYQNALANPDFHLDDGTYEDPANWKCFNDFFARRLSDPSVRPIAEQDNDSVVISPADAVPQGVWTVDADSRVANSVSDDDTEDSRGIAIKTGTLTDVSVLLSGSAYADAFSGGILTHTFLDVNDYHRYHFPVSGTILEAFIIPADDAPGGVITWDTEARRYKEYWSELFGWQSIETRGVIVMRMTNGALAAIVPVGMCEISSVNFEPSVLPGSTVQKGDPMGCFLFGGSDIVMIFSEDAAFELTAEQGVHINMGTAYGTIK